MTRKITIARIATGSAVTAFAVLALAGPANAVVLAPTGGTQPTQVAATSPVNHSGTDHSQIGLGALAGAVLGGAGMATVVTRRRPHRRVPRPA